jgi:DNA-binding transcriptional regulator YiaG
MPTLAATLKSEIRRITGREMKKVGRPLVRLTRQVRLLRQLTRVQRRTMAKLERRLQRVGSRTGGARRLRTMDAGPRVSPAAIRALRSRMKMTRLQFAKLLSVSAGSIFGWETGRSTPRGASRKKLVDLKGNVGAGGKRRGPGRPRKGGRRRAR